MQYDVDPPVNPDRKSYTVTTFRWCDTEYSPRQLEQVHGHRVPFLVMTTQGYMGRDEAANAIGATEMYWIKEVARQPRVVVQGTDTGYYSIPLDYPNKVWAMAGGQPVREAMRISDLVESSYKTFQFEGEAQKHTASLNVYDGPNTGQSVRFGTLKIVDQYQERYLVAHAISGGHLHYEECIIPLYMPVPMVIAVGRGRNDIDVFYQTMLKMKSFVDSIPPELARRTRILEKSDILVYDGALPQGDYDYITPLLYVSLQNVATRNRESVAYTELVKDKPTDQGKEAYVSSGLYSLATEIPPLSPKIIKNKDTKKSRRKSKKEKKLTLNDVKFVDQFGGERSPDTNISLLHKTNHYHISDYDPQFRLDEMQQVLMTGTIPETSTVRDDLWTDSGGEDEISPTPLRVTCYMESHPLKPVKRPLQKPTRDPPKPPVTPPPDVISSAQESLGNPYSVDPTQQDRGHQKSVWFANNPEQNPDGASHSRQFQEMPKAPPRANTAPATLPKPKPPLLHPRLDAQSSVGISSNEPPPSLPPRMPSKDYSTDRDVSSPESPGYYNMLPPAPPPAGNTNAQRRAPPQSGKDDVLEMGIKTLGEKLEELNLGGYRRAFEEQQIDGRFLVESMDEQMLVSDLGFKRLEAVRLMKYARDGWRPT